MSPGYIDPAISPGHEINPREDDGKYSENSCFHTFCHLITHKHCVMTILNQKAIRSAFFFGTDTSHLIHFPDGVMQCHQVSQAVTGFQLPERDVSPQDGSPDEPVRSVCAAVSDDDTSPAASRAFFRNSSTAPIPGNKLPSVARIPEKKSSNWYSAPSTSS